MFRIAAVLVTVMVAGCTAAPVVVPSASRSPSPTVPAASPPAVTSTPAPIPSRTPIPLPNTAQIDASSGNVVWVLVGDQNGRLFRSADRGDTWRESTVPPIAPAIISVIDDREGWAMVPRVGVPPPVGGQCGSPTNLSHTTDGGTTWQEIVTTGMPAPGPCKNSIRFADAQHGFISAVDPAGSPVCDAVVTATDHDFVAALQAFPNDTPCRYAGVTERKGTYSIAVSHGTATANVSGVKVTADECHVRPTAITVQLNR